MVLIIIIQVIFPLNVSFIEVFPSQPLINFVISRSPPQCLLTHIHLSTSLFSACNGHMKVICPTMMLTYRLMKPPWCSLLICICPIFSRSFHRCPIQHNRRHKLQGSLIRSKGQANLGVPSGMPPRKILKLQRCQRCDFMHFEGKVLQEMSFLLS